MAGRSLPGRRKEEVSTSTQEVFDAGRFGKWLRMMLVAFYSDEEAAVADVLFRRQAMMKDSHLAKTLRLPERQVRQLLEARLLPDCIVDKRSDGTGDRLSSLPYLSFGFAHGGTEATNLGVVFGNEK